MGQNIHESQYDRVMEQLEQIVDHDPDFEQQDEQDFIDEITESNLGGFTTPQARRIRSLWEKYVQNRIFDQQQECKES